MGNWLEQCIRNRKVRGSNLTGGTRHMSREKSMNASFISDIDETVQLSFTLLTSCLTLFLMAEGQMPDIFSTLIDGRRCRSGRTGFETEIETLSIWFHGRYYTSYGI